MAFAEVPLDNPLAYTCPECMVLPLVQCRWSTGGGVTEARPGLFHERRNDMAVGMLPAEALNISKDSKDKAFQSAIDEVA